METNLDDEIGPTLFVDVSKRQGRARLRAMLRRALPGPWRWNNCDGHMVATGAPDFWPEGEGYGQQKWPIYVIYVDAPRTVWAKCQALMSSWSTARRKRMDDYSVDTARLIPAAVNSLGPLLDALDAAEAQIARLTAPVTEAEMQRLDNDWAESKDDTIEAYRTALTAFLERRMKG